MLGQDIGEVPDYIDQIEKHHEPIRLSQLAINGDDLKSMGYEGKEIGIALEKCLGHVLEHPEDNTPKKLIKLLQQ